MSQFDIDCDLLVDFDDIEHVQIEEKPINTDIYFKTCGIEFDDSTTMFYKVMRERNLNVFTQDDNIETDKCFQFRHMWDTFTGERLGLDPCGSLWFHPTELVNYFSSRCLNNLWHEQVDETGGVYEGYYGDLLGCGENMYIIGRGYYTELYLFRLPIVDCYMPKNTNLSLITMGPKLTDEELQEIDNLMDKYYTKMYLKRFNKNPLSLVQIKKYYDMALNPNPALQIIGISKDSEHLMSEEELKFNRTKVNMYAVDKLKLMVKNNC